MTGLTANQTVFTATVQILGFNTEIEINALDTYEIEEWNELAKLERKAFVQDIAEELATEYYDMSYVAKDDTNFTFVLNYGDGYTETCDIDIYEYINKEDWAEMAKLEKKGFVLDQLEEWGMDFIEVKSGC